MKSSLKDFLNPSAVAFIGATERSVWSNIAHGNLQTVGYTGRFYPVNRRGGTIYGRTAATSAAQIGELVDIALLMVPAEALEASFADLQEAGIRHAVVLSSGFAEAGQVGQQRQRELVEMGRRHQVDILGPNCLGFANFVDHCAVWTGALRTPLPAGPVGLASQSGALAGQMSYLAQVHGIGLSRMISTGNEADICIAEVLDYLVDDPHTKAISVFAESIRSPALFSQAAQKALDRHKPVVIFKMGSSEIAARAAQAHTGALVGDDRVFDAMCQRYGLMRVRSIEDAVFTAAFAAQSGPLATSRIAVASMSGGMCEILAERADDESLELAPFSVATQQSLQKILPDYATPQNPLDVTGASILQPDLFGDALRILTHEPGIGAVFVVADVPNAVANDSAINRGIVEQVARGFADSPVPALAFSHYVMSVSELSRDIIAAYHLPYIACGIHHAMSAAGAVMRWSSRLRCQTSPEKVTSSLASSAVRPTSEHALLQWLAQQRVPVVPFRLTRTADEAVDSAQGWGDDGVVLKIASQDIAHKTEVGGVVLDVRGRQSIESTWKELQERVRTARPDALIDGILVAPMRRGGIELFVGVIRDPLWGPALLLGLGGVWVEALRDTSLRLLPVTRYDVFEMLNELRCARLLDGWRGASAIDRDRLAEVVIAIGDAAMALGPDLLSLEINPLRADGSSIEALDALAVWASPNHLALDDHKV